MTTPPVEQALDTVLGAIYDAALSPQGWPAALAGVGSRLGARSAFLFSTHSSTEPAAVQHVHNHRPEMVRDFLAHWHTEDAWAIAAAQAGRLHAGTLVLGSELVPREQLLRTAFYNEFAREHGIESMVGVILFDGTEEDAMPFTIVSWYRPPGEPDFDPAVKDTLRELVPHLRRALRIQRRLVMPGRQAVRGALDALRLASLVLDDKGLVRHADPEARALLAQLPAGAYRFGQLRTLGERCEPPIPDAIAACRPDLPVRLVAWLPGSPPCVLGATLLRLPEQAGPVRPDAEPSADYLLLVDVPRRDGENAARAVAALFGLTPAEVRVLGGLLDGRSPAQIAAEASVSMPTVRTQISHILGKTRCQGQTDLVALLRTLR